MDPLLAEQIRGMLITLPDLVDHLETSVMLESVLYGDLPTFDCLTPEGWRTRHDGRRDLLQLADSFLPVLTGNTEARLIIIFDERTGRRVPHAITRTMKGVMYLLEHPEFDAFMSLEPERLVLVTLDDGGARILPGRGKEMILFVQRTRSPRATVDLEPPPD